MNIWTILFLIAAAQGVFLSFLILRLKKGIKYANFLLASLILLFSLTLVYYVAYWSGIENQLPGFVKITLSFVWLFGPLVFLYLNALNRQVFRNNDLWHFMPFLIIILFQGFKQLSSAGDNEMLVAMNLNQVTIGIILLQLGHLFIYAFLIYKYLRKSVFNGKTSSLQHRWTSGIMYFYIGFCISYTSYYLLFWSGNLTVEQDYAISLAMSVFIYMVGYYGFTKPEILNGNSNASKYLNSTLGESASKHLMEKLLLHMKNEKPYVNSDLKLGELARQVNMSTHHLSQIINENRQQNFSDFINFYRINYAKMLLTNNADGTKKLINIAYDSGFNNKVSFNNAFKKFTGSSPSEYRRLETRHNNNIAAQ